MIDSVKVTCCTCKKELISESPYADQREDNYCDECRGVRLKFIKERAFTVIQNKEYLPKEYANILIDEIFRLEEINLALRINSGITKEGEITL
ncbi:hypothetical protein [Virgibacillus salexigens]|uniref:Uncharacterized protein n=1 Tax=Virgibacillus massiliensis TaxID=1462526 RepID=A0A024QHB7_9BACI|nr:hypothetical protein [Virgibacillus massiliensis]CDQ41889.1 hypothetical protein BN990_04268 [Virgibacillus massiliensis]